MSGHHKTIGELVYVQLLNRYGNGPREVFKASIDGARVFACLWAMSETHRRIGHWPTRAEYIEDWGGSPRSVSREWALVRAAFDLSPDDNFESIGAWIAMQRYESRATNTKQLEALAPPSSLATA